MNVSAPILSTSQISVKKIFITLLAAFLGNQLNLVGMFVTVMALFASSNFLGIPPNPVTVAMLAIPSFLLLWASFLALSLYPERGRRQLVAGFLALVLWALGVIVSYSTQLLRFLDPYDKSQGSYAFEIGIVIAVAACLWASGRIKNRLDLVGLGFGLVIGIGLRNTGFYDPHSPDFSSIWLSAVLFPQLFSGRANWQTKLIGILLWVGLIILSYYLSQAVEQILF